MRSNLQYYKPVKSNRPEKKFMVRIYLPKLKRDKIIHFGASSYQDFTQHKNKLRKANYLRRSAFIRDRNGKLTRKDYRSPNFWARRFLWDSKESYGRLPRPRI